LLPLKGFTINDTENMSDLLNNRYRILKNLGRGGSGETFLAEDTHLPSSRRCVIKQLKPLSTDPDVYRILKERFDREAAILETLGRDHDQIPTLHAYFAENKEFYLVQDWIDGRTLTEQYRYEGALAKTTLCELLSSLLSVLEFVHGRGIIHRDIKPDNVMIRASDGKPVLIDFGAVKSVVTASIDSRGNPTSSVIIGTPGYMPLEQMDGHPVFSSDLYSLGLTAIYALTGNRLRNFGIQLLET
jgi:serine/threonine protein kinase, bacterial